MKNTFIRVISMVLTVALLLCAAVPVLAEEYEDEEYLSDLRIIYAEDYDEAAEILEDSDLEGYRLLDANLNENTGKIGVFLAYLPTSDVEDAITDIAIMQMNGGYKEGNYQAMIDASYQEYLGTGNIYLEAIDYFKKAYNADNYLAKVAYRQLNFYNVVTEGIEEEPYFEGERIGDIFLDGISASDLATMFMEGNSYALSNIRSLIAMGTSYNEDGKTYLEKVADEAGKYTADRSVYKNQDYRDTAALISPTITTFRDMLKELEAHADELNYDDGDLTDIELKYLEYKLISEMLEKTSYLDGKSLYDFCIKYTVDKDDYSDLYPLVAALNAGQLAMTKVAHYYDVVRYSMTLTEDEEIEAELAKLDEEYSENPFNIYTGVDRTIYRDTFALTTDAYRADAYTEAGLSAALFTGDYSGFNKAARVFGYLGSAFMAYGLAQYGYTYWTTRAAFTEYQRQFDSLLNQFANYHELHNVIGYNGYPAKDAINDLFKDCILQQEQYSYDEVVNWTIQQKYAHLETYFNASLIKDETALNNFAHIKNQLASFGAKDEIFKSAQDAASNATQKVAESSTVLKGCFVIGGIMLVASALKLGYSAWHYYHPDYDDIPAAMVDLINTKDGDRYIKYDVVCEAEETDGALVAADLNAFSASRWNAMYYTKSYEAGKPLLADEFAVSYASNVPEETYAPIHRFGEVVSYNLNKYNFNDDFSIYLSVKQSENQKHAVSDVPELVGSVFSAGYMLLSGAVGVAVGAFGTVATQSFVKKRKNGTNTEAEAVE